MSPIAPAPDWLVALTRKRPTISERALATMRVPLQYNGSPGAYGRAALEYEIAALAGTRTGSAITRSIARRSRCSNWSPAANLTEAEVINRLIEAAYANGLMTDPNDGPASVGRTIASGRRAGIQHPRVPIGCHMSAPELRPYQHDIIAEFDRCVAAGDRAHHVGGADRIGQDRHRRRHHQADLRRCESSCWCSRIGARSSRRPARSCATSRIPARHHHGRHPAAAAGKRAGRGDPDTAPARHRRRHDGAAAGRSAGDR